MNTTPVKTFFNHSQIPADKYYEGGKVHYRLAWDGTINTARIVFSFRLPRDGNDVPTRGTRINVRVEIGSGAMMMCVGETSTTWTSKNQMYVWMANFARSVGMR